MESIINQTTNFIFTPSWGRTILLIVMIDWIIGIIFIQYFYYRTRKLRYLNKKQYPELSPFINSTYTWNRFAHLLGSVFMVPRMLIFASGVISITMFVHIISVGSKLPLTGLRRKIMVLFGRMIGRIMLFSLSFTWVSYADDKIDYSSWLGKEYKPSEEKPPIIISNHRGCSVVFYVLYRMYFYL